MSAPTPLPDSLDSLDRLEPGPELSAELADIDMSRVDDEDLVTVIRAHQRAMSHHQAAVYAGICHLVERYHDLHGDLALATDGAAVEIAAALHLTRRAATTDVDFATRLHARLPEVAALLDRGVVDPRRARVIAAETDHLPAADARAVVDQIIDDAPAFTTGQIRARLRRLGIEADPDRAAKRYDDAVDRRRLVTRQTPDGTIDLLGLDLPAARAATISRRIDRIARSLRGPGEDRSMDQLRSDVFVDLLDGRSFGSGTDRAHVDITVSLDTLIGHSDEPGELKGYGPVVADLARRIVEDQPDAEWRFTVTDRRGEPLHTGTTRRRPDTATRRAVEARRRRCVFPGCRMPATSSDLDHTTPWAQGGSTTSRNLAPLCRYHHTRRHLHGWSYRETADGDILWLSPLGLRYLTSGRAP